MAEKQFYSGRVPQHIYDAAEKFCELEGISKTDLLVNALSEYLGRPKELPSVDEAVLKNINNLQERVAHIEKQLESVKAKSKEANSKQLILENLNDNNNVINNNKESDFQIVTTNKVTELTGISRKSLEYMKKNNQFPKSGKGWTVIGFAGKQDQSPYSNTWKVAQDA